MIGLYNRNNILLEKEYGTAVCAPDAEVPTAGQKSVYKNLVSKAQAGGIEIVAGELDKRSDYSREIERLVLRLENKGIDSGYKRSRPITHEASKPRINPIFLRKPYSL